MEEPLPLMGEPWATLPEVLAADPVTTMTQLIRRCGKLETILERKQQESHESQRNLLRSLLEIVDDLDRVLAQHPLKSIELTRRKLKDILEQQGVVGLNTLGKAFDPHHSDLDGYQERDDLPDETVIQELVTGYVWRGEVLRRAVVIVSKKR
ncbi:MAG TPA: nucleotide exchange factor GrpE [Anaerolineae bacterium]|nr:nucleotide exchange factor GrpE [Anaerolineae bacterium]